MSTDALHSNRRRLEDEFFLREAEEKVAALRAKLARTATRDEIQRASGITNDEILDKLAELKIEAHTLAALALVPLVEVAWANGVVEPGERKAILEEMDKADVPDGSPSFALLEQWLGRRPGPRMLEAWTTYTQGLCESLDESEIAELKAGVLGRARRVAEASGGFLGLGNKISPEEETMLGVLEKAFGQGE